MMHRRAKSALALIAAAGVFIGCSDYFEGPRLDENPNVPSDATADQLFIGAQSFQFAQLTGDVNRVISAWMHHVAGSGRQWSGYDANYEVTENDFLWDGFYTGGGLVDIRRIQEIVAEDPVYLGIAQVWEALVVSTVADVWGDIPYRESIAGIPEPVLDPQEQVYRDLLALLDVAIGNLGGSGSGPGAADLVYGGNTTQWIEAAHTLKARIYMHLAERDPTAYTSAITEANLGISSEANDFTAYHSAGEGEENHWFQFRIQRGTDLSAGKFIVDLMKARNDPRLNEYFSPGPAAGGVIIGAAPGQEANSTIAWLGAARGAADFRQPILTYAENQLILAEALFKTNQGAAALTALNTYRATVPLPALSVSGPALYTAIMEEKYVALFQNIEVWNDYKRTCYPNFAPNTGSSIPARLVYPSTERNVNDNVPAPSEQPRRNWNDPVTPTSTNGAACLGQA